MTPIKEAARALSSDARIALLNTNPEVGAVVPSTTFVTDDALWHAQAMRGDGRLTPFGLMLREAVLELELDTMDPPDAPEVLPMHVRQARSLSEDARGVLLAMVGEVGAPPPSAVTRVVGEELLSRRLINASDRLTPLGLVVRKAAEELDTPDRGMADPYGDNVRELVAAAKAWFTVRRERGHPLERHEIRLWKAIRGLS